MKLTDLLYMIDDGGEVPSGAGDPPPPAGVPADSGAQQPDAGATQTPSEAGDPPTGEKPADGTPPSGEDGSGTADPESPEEKAKTERRNSFQKRINEKTDQAREANQRAEAAERRAAVAEAQLKAPTGPNGQPVADPNDPGEFPTLEAYNYDQTEYQRAVIEYNAKLTSRTINQSMANQDRANAVQASREAQGAVIETFKERSAAYADDHPDFYTKVSSAGFGQTITQAVVMSENGPQVADHIASNPALVLELNALPAPAALMRVGALSAQFSTPVTPRTTVTPAPADPPLGGQGTKVVKDPDKMSPNEYAKSRGYRTKRS